MSKYQNMNKIKERYIFRLKNRNKAWRVIYFNYNYFRDTDYKEICEEFFVDHAKRIIGDKLDFVTVKTNTGTGSVIVRVVLDKK